MKLVTWVAITMSGCCVLLFITAYALQRDLAVSVAASEFWQQRLRMAESRLHGREEALGDVLDEFRRTGKLTCNATTQNLAAVNVSDTAAGLTITGWDVRMDCPDRDTFRTTIRRKKEAIDAAK